MSNDHMKTDIHSAAEISRQMSSGDRILSIDASVSAAYRVGGEMRSAFQREEVLLRFSFESGKKMLAVLGEDAQ